jgi:protein tyrosine/serine phosphatase
MRKQLICILFFCLLVDSSFGGGKPVAAAYTSPAIRIPLSTFHNLYQVNATVFRSEQPSEKGFIALDSMGIKSVLNLRLHHDDTQFTKSPNIKLYRVRMDAGKISLEELIQALSIIKQAEKPVLIHCWHGSDRTGCVVAAYRIVFENWTKDQAIAELKYPPFGYHYSAYPNIVSLLKSLDVKVIRKKIGLEV